jgi:ribosomal-protein-alanine N-acetyltransferase
MELLKIDKQILENIHKELINDEVKEVAQFQNDYYEKIGFTLPWIGYFAKEDNQIVGACSFDGAPENNIVEIFFYTFAEFENRGYATSMVKELMSITKNENTNVWITARTLPKDNASTKVLKKCNFELTGTANDSNDGIVWEWIFR